MFLQYLEEKKKTKEEDADEGEGKQNIRGVLHELLVHHHLVHKHGARATHFNDGRATAEEEHHRIATKLFGDNYKNSAEYKDMSRKAEDAADAIRNHVGDNWEKGKTRVAWTSKHGDVEKITGKQTHQADDSSDVYVSHRGGHLGVSLKTVKEKNGIAPISNGGRGDVDRLLGVNTDHHLEAARKAVIAAHPIMAGLTGIAAKRMLKANPEIAATEATERTKALGNIARDYRDAFERMDSRQRAETLRRSMRATDTGHAHIRLTSGGTNGNYSQKIEHPVTQHNHILNDHENIHAEIAGNNTVQFYHKHPVTGEITKFHNIRLKAADSSGIFGSQKTSGANNPFAKPKPSAKPKTVPAETVAVGQNEPDENRPGLSKLRGSTAVIRPAPATPRVRIAKPKVAAAPKPKRASAPRQNRSVLPKPANIEKKKPGGVHAGRPFYAPGEIKGE